MAEGDFQRLLEVMPKIAEAVKDLPDGLKERAYEDLISSFNGVPSPRPAPMEALPASQQTNEAGSVTEAEEETDVEPAATGGRSRKAKKATAPRKATGRRSWTPVRDIDFRPSGKQAFRDLVAEKNPTTIHQKNLLAVYWLEQVYELSEIGVGHVLAAYKECTWREPGHPNTALRNTAFLNSWIDTSSMKAIKTTPRGRNTVEHDMPITTKAKK
ncbi:hypothetical protein [Micromonospora sp. NBRC 110037]|uniref:hypothetical protein n=1 Tax=Micromonospora sp. NBRC 110037 TaxID=1621261 RepID=UPI0012F8F27E|nr:hypothetical protein [Micromonospora sp. NBRC 110037]